ncbi:MAG: hypothetical protein WC707_01175 [Candidatus Babeliaceae bacterium]|jgi:WD40 repeat protein
MSKPFFKNFILFALPFSIFIYGMEKATPSFWDNIKKYMYALQKKLKKQESIIENNYLATPYSLHIKRPEFAQQVSLPAELIDKSNKIKLPYNNNVIDFSKNKLFTYDNLLLLKKYWAALKMEKTLVNIIKKYWNALMGIPPLIQSTVDDLVTVKKMADVLDNTELTNFVDKIKIEYDKDRKKIPSALSNALLLIQPKPLITEDSKVTSLHITPDGKKIIIGLASSSTTKIFDLTQHDFIKTFENAKYATITPDGKKIITALFEKITVRNVNESYTQNTIPYPQAYGRIQSLLTTPDGTKIISRNQDGSIINIWDIETGEIKQIDNKAPSSSSTITPNSEKLIVGGDGVINIFDINTAALVGTIRKPGEKITSLLATADDEIIFGSHNGNITILNTTQNASETFNNTMPINVIIQIPLSPYIAFNRGPALIIMDTITKTFFPIGNPHNDIYPKEAMVAIATAPHSTKIISAGEHGTVYSWDISVLQNYTNSLYAI